MDKKSTLRLCSKTHHVRCVPIAIQHRRTSNLTPQNTSQRLSSTAGARTPSRRKLVATAAADSLPLPFSSSGHTSAPMASPLAVFHPASATAAAAARRHHPPRPPPLHLHLPLHHQPSSPRRRFAAEVLPNPCTQPSYPP